jgi:uncharacterized protein GlcG (DUF336 family)
MKNIKTFDLKDAKKAMAAIEKIALKKGLKISICIVDCAGNAILQQRMDGAILHTFDLSRSKAYSAIYMSNTSGFIGKIIKEHGAELSYFDGSIKTGWKGGVPAFNRDDSSTPIGAIGVSGATEDEDEELAVEGLKAIGFNKR